MSDSDDDLNRLLRPTPDEAPADLDALIRNQARAAVKADADTTTEQATTFARRRPSRLLRTLPVAAVLVLSIGLIPRLQQQPVDDRSIGAPSPVASAERPASQSLDDVTPERLQSAEREAPSAFSADEAMASDAETQSKASMTASSAPEARMRMPLADSDRRAESDAIGDQRTAGVTTTRLDTAMTEASEILALLRANKPDAATATYERWRDQWPNAEPVPAIEGMTPAERDWFEAAAERVDRSRSR